MPNSANGGALQPPVAQKNPTTRSFHGYEVSDDYEWLRDKDAARPYLEAENAYTDAVTAGLEELQENIFQEIKARTKETDMSIPSRMGPWWYFSRTVEGKSYGLSCRVPVTDPDNWLPPTVQPGVELPGEEVMLDSNELAEGHEFFSLGALAATTSGNLLAYSVDTAGNERFTLRVKDLRTGELLEDELTGISYGATWVGEEYLFYQRVDESWRPDSVWRHRIGTPASEDVEVFHEADEHFWVGVGLTTSDKYVVIASGSKVTSEQWYLDIGDPTGEFTCIRPREAGVEYDCDHAVFGGVDYWLTTHNKTHPDFAAAVSPVGKPLLLDESFRPHREGHRLDGFGVHKSFLLCGERVEGLQKAWLTQLPDSDADSVLDHARNLDNWQEIRFDEELASVGAGGMAEWDVPAIRVSYTSFITPAKVYHYELATGKKTLLKEREVLGGYNREDYRAQRIWVEAADGAHIPVSLVYRTDGDGEAGPLPGVSTQRPVILYGYGAYEVTTDPSFSIARLSLLDRGIIFAIAHVRGGGEMGRAWYDNGKGLTKKNTFTDFIAVADALIARGITTPEHMAALGGSAGGLLMGAVANMGGDRFAAIEANVPFVDPLTSILMPELPLTVTEWDEWGDPYHDPAVYEYMASYAPYENVAAAPYPNILATTSLNDTRVLYVEPAKWIAKLRETATSGQFLLKTEMVAGHGGVSGRYESWRQTAFEYGWLVNQITGLTA
ncbi:MAG: S9 family peptidase [Corynebacterium sp.]|nr:S9 family peptidase [Corynebacterium sp.]